MRLERQVVGGKDHIGHFARLQVFEFDSKFIVSEKVAKPSHSD